MICINRKAIADVLDFMKLGKYVVLETLQENSNAKVYVARKQGKEGRVVLKIFAFGSSNWKTLDAIENEYKAISKISHPQIPKVLDYFKTKQEVCIVLEHIEGKPLPTGIRYSDDKIFEIAFQLLDILQYLEKNHIVHHDIKPSNILIDSNQKIYLIDFGIAKEISSRTMGLTTQFAGTNGYIAPEKVLGRKADSRSDLYSLGVTLAVLKLGVRESQAHSILNNKFEVKKCFRSGAKILVFIHNLVQLSPEDRYCNTVNAMKRASYFGKPAVDRRSVKEKSSHICVEVALYIVLLVLSIGLMLFSLRDMVSMITGELYFSEINKTIVDELMFVIVGIRDLFLVLSIVGLTAFLLLRKW